MDGIMSEARSSSSRSLTRRRESVRQLLLRCRVISHHLHPEGLHRMATRDPMRPSRLSQRFIVQLNSEEFRRVHSPLEEALAKGSFLHTASIKAMVNSVPPEYYPPGCSSLKLREGGCLNVILSRPPGPPATSVAFPPQDSRCKRRAGTGIMPS